MNSLFSSFSERVRPQRRQLPFSLRGPLSDLAVDHCSWPIRSRWREWPCYRGGSLLRLGGLDPMTAAWEERVNA